MNRVIFTFSKQKRKCTFFSTHLPMLSISMCFESLEKRYQYTICFHLYCLLHDYWPFALLFLCEIMYCITLLLHKNVCHVLCQFSVGEFHKLIVSVLYFKSFNKYLLKIKDRKYSYLPPKEGNRCGCGIHSDHLAQRGVIVLFDMKCKERPKIQ